MDYISHIVKYVQSFDWNSPQAFGVAAAIGALLFKRWLIMFTAIAVMFIGANIEKVYIINYEFNDYTVTSPFIVYAIGAVLIGIMAFLSLFNR